MTITTFRLKSATTQAAAPFTLGHAFKKGDVPAGIQLVSGFPSMQVVPKNVWDDGSLKFAVISGRAALSANVPLTVALDAGAPVGGMALSTAALKATGVTASITLTGAKDWTWDTAAHTVGYKHTKLDPLDVPDATSLITVGNGATISSTTVTDAGAVANITATLSGGTVNGYQGMNGVVKMHRVRSINAITKAANVRVTTNSSLFTVNTGNGLSVGDSVFFSGIGGMTQMNGLTGTVTAVDPLNSWFELNINSTGFSTYTSGGTMKKMTISDRPDAPHLNDVYNFSDIAYVRTGGGIEWNGSINTYAASNTVADVANASWATTDWDSPFKVWVSGPEMSSWIYRKPLGTNAHLVAWLEVRLYAGGAVEILPWVENGFLNVVRPTSFKGVYGFTLGGTSRFSATLDFANHVRTPLVSGAALSHWLGTDPGVTHKHDNTYLQSTRLVPTYGVVPNDDVVARQIKTYAPFQAGNYPGGMGSAGYDPSIGLLPQWDVVYLTSTDFTTLNSVVANGYSAGRYGIHFRDEATNRPLRFSSYPNLVASETSGISGTGASTTNSFTPRGTGLAIATWASTHHPSSGFLAYLVTGRFMFMEQMQFVATVHFLKNTDSTRGFTKGILHTNVGANTTRGAAWDTRSLAQAATLTPDDDTPLRTELLNSLTENILFYHGTYVAQANNPQGFVSPYSDYTGVGDGNWHEAIWMQDFFTAAYGYAADMEPAITPANRTKLDEFFAWKAISIVGRFGGTAPTEYLYRDAAIYTGAVAPTDFPDFGGGTGPWFANWGQMYQATHGVPNSGVAGDLRGGNYPEASSYWGNLQPALAYAVSRGVAGASTGYGRMIGANNWTAFLTSLPTAPEWGVVPRVNAGPVEEEPPDVVTGARTRADTTSLVPGKTVAGVRGLGVLGAAIPALGTHGPSVLYPTLDASDLDAELSVQILTVPTAGDFFMFEDGSWHLRDAPDGEYSFTYKVKRLNTVMLNPQGGDTATMFISVGDNALSNDGTSQDNETTVGSLGQPHGLIPTVCDQANESSVGRVDAGLAGNTVTQENESTIAAITQVHNVTGVNSFQINTSKYFGANLGNAMGLVFALVRKLTFILKNFIRE